MRLLHALRNEWIAKEPYQPLTTQPYISTKGSRLTRGDDVITVLNAGVTCDAIRNEDRHMQLQHERRRPKVRCAPWHHIPTVTITAAFSLEQSCAHAAINAYVPFLQLRTGCQEPGIIPRAHDWMPQLCSWLAKPLQN